MKLLVLGMIIGGEILNIYAEMKGAQLFAHQGVSFGKIFVSLGMFVMTGALLLLAGYMLGLQTFKNIWIVSAVAITTIVILEPIMAYAIAGQTPTPGALVGFVLGVLGLFIALFW